MNKSPTPANNILRAGIRLANKMKNARQRISYWDTISYQCLSVYTMKPLNVRFDVLLQIRHFIACGFSNTCTFHYFELETFFHKRKKMSDWTKMMYKFLPIFSLLIGPRNRNRLQNLPVIVLHCAYRREQILYASSSFFASERVSEKPKNKNKIENK